MTDRIADRIHAALTTILENYATTLSPARRATGAHVLTSLVNPPLPLSAAILDTRATAHERLAYWAQLVIRGRKLHHLAAVDAPTLAVFLLIHVGWLATHHWAHHALAELENSAATLSVIAADNAPHQFRVGTCPGTTGDLPCPGVVKATVRADDDLLPSALTCDAIPAHSWPAGEWRVLERRLHMDEGAARRLAAAIGA